MQALALLQVPNGQAPTPRYIYMGQALGGERLWATRNAGETAQNGDYGAPSERPSS